VVETVKMEKFDWKTTIKMNIFSLRIIGLWPKGDGVYKLDFYSLYAAISVIFFIDCLGILQITSLFFAYSDFEDLTEMAVISMSELLTVIKVCIFIKNMGLLKSLMATLDSDMFQPKNIDQILMVAPALNLWKTIYNVFFAAGGIATSLLVILPLLDGSKNFQLPLTIWYPHDINSSPLYEIMYFHQVISLFFILTAIYNIDMLISALMMYIGAQCDILCNNLRNFSTDGGEDFNKILIHLIKHHRSILRFFALLGVILLCCEASPFQNEKF
ncbi:7tm 6 domain containing protein, partial [Asbolus verrucosus]